MKKQTKKNKHLRTYRAFTLLEVVIALAITSVSLLALLKLQVVSSALADTAELTNQAVLIGDGKIAETLAEGYPNLGVTTGIVEHGNISFQWRREVTEAYPAQFGNFNPDLLQNGIRKISVNIKWKTGLGYKYFDLSTYVADRTLQ
jgi:prepilin-type N-terminal cleavage/methylation domain-containing protein